ncbi:MAG: hypothetical protein IKN85_06770 [Oscillospiraceae bacterium]|nr:hypothetical protein [Oscillospiraceae bacterium]MBR3535513.1 hypothetical protein [Oscillospiraceae bacterium]
MNIWKVTANEGYNNAFLVDENGNQCFDAISDFMEIQNSQRIRTLKIETTDKGFPDVMNYWGTNGTVLVNSKVKDLLEKYYSGLSIQFFPCECKQDIALNFWTLNVCEYHDVLDLNKSICKKMNNIQGDEVVRLVKKYAFKKEAFDLDLFKIYLNNRKYSTSLFVSDRLKKVMEDNDVVGLTLEKVYSI